MNSAGVIRLQGHPSACRATCPFNPGSAIPFGGPQQLLQFYQDFNWVKGKHDLRFGGSFVHIRDDRTFGAYANSVQALNINATALVSLNNFTTGNLRRFQGAIDPQGNTPATRSSRRSASRTSRATTATTSSRSTSTTPGA